MSAVTVTPCGVCGETRQINLKKRRKKSLVGGRVRLPQREESDVKRSQSAESGDEGEGGAISSLTPLNVHLMMHT